MRAAAVADQAAGAAGEQWPDLLSTDEDCDAQLIALLESVQALGLPAVAPAVDDASSPYLDTDFESELAALALAAGADGADSV